MENLYDYKRFSVLYVDDEDKSLKYFARAFGDQFRILTATNAAEGFRVIEQNADDIGIIMSDQRMPGEKGVQFLDKARQFRPRIIRILATAFSDLEAAIDAVNTGAIYKYVTKPWEPPALEMTLKRSLEHFMVQRERDMLLREKLSVLHNLVIADRILGLGVLGAGLGHGVRNSMTAVRAFLELAPDAIQRDHLDLNQLRHPGFWKEFHRKVHARVRLVLDLVDGAGPESPEADICLREAINTAIAAATPEIQRRRITVTNTVPDSLPALHLDARRFSRLFSFILRNELANLQDGASIRFEARLVDSATPEVELLVTDNGPGLPHEPIVSIFDPFFPQNGAAEEFGAYLMACYFIVYHHGGRLELQPIRSGGLQWRITLPLKAEAPGAADQAEQFIVGAMTNPRLWERLVGGG
jgi:two-component system probable response regulator PhcQ